MNLAAYIPRSLTMTAAPDDWSLIQRRIVQVVAITTFLGSIAAAGVYGGRLLSSIDSLTSSVVELRAEVRASSQAAMNDRYELRALRERVERLEAAQRTQPPR